MNIFDDLPDEQLAKLADVILSLAEKISEANSPEEPIFFNSPKEAAKSKPSVYGTPYAVQNKLRYREFNGLLACGAVVEHYAHEEARPTLTINHQKWVKWQSRPNKKIAA